MADTLKTLDYGTFLSIVAEGRKNVSAGQEKVMPAFGDNKNVYCYLDDIYIYLRSRSRRPAARTATQRMPPSRRQQRKPRTYAWVAEMTRPRTWTMRTVLLMVGAMTMSPPLALAQGASLGAAGELVDPNVLQIVLR